MDIFSVRYLGRCTWMNFLLSRDRLLIGKFLILFDICDRVHIRDMLECTESMHSKMELEKRNSTYVLIIS